MRATPPASRILMALCFAAPAQAPATVVLEEPPPFTMAESLDALLLAQLRAAPDATTRERAFTELVRRHSLALAAFLSGFVAEPGARDDLVQETFLRAYRGLDRFDAAGTARFRTYLFTIGRNVALDLLRQRGRRPEQPLGDAEDQAPSLDQGPLVEAIRRQGQGEVRAALARLPEEDRTAVVLRFYEDAEFTAIGEVLGATPAAAKQRTWRALRKLRDLLGGEGAR